MWVSIEGNIGSGKTTVFQQLQDLKRDWIFAEEPVHSWIVPHKELGNKSMLDTFYEDPEKNGSFFQAYALSTRLAILRPLLELPSSQIIISERSPESDSEIFAPLMKMRPFENACQTSIQDCLVNKVPDLVLQIHTSPETCMHRIATRGRSSETGISLEYILNVDKQHEEYMKKLKMQGRKFFIVDGEESKDSVYSNVLHLIPDYK